MGKRGGKNKNSHGDKAEESNSKQLKGSENIPRAYDKDTAVFILMSHELKDEGNRLFQQKDYEGAMLKYEKAINLLPRNHIDVSYLRSNMAACYMQLGITEYPRAIHECNLALEVTPNYSKALLKRARCYEALNRLDLAIRDAGTVLKREPNNLMAIEVAERVKQAIEKHVVKENPIPFDLIPLPVEPLQSQTEASKGKGRKKNSKMDENNSVGKKEESEDEKGRVEKHVNRETEERKLNVTDVIQKTEGVIEERKTDNPLVVEEGIISNGKGKTQKKKRNKMDKKKADGKKEEKVDGKKEGEIAGKKEGSKDEKGRFQKKANRETEGIKVHSEDVLQKTDDVTEEKKTEDKMVVEEERISNGKGEEPTRSVKLVCGEDIRCAQIPIDCSITKLREIISDRFPSLEGVLIKYKDQEDDLVTMTSTEELRIAEASTVRGSVKLYVVEVKSDKDPFFGKIRKDESKGTINTKSATENGHLPEKKEIKSESVHISDWMIQFAQLFKSHVGFDIDANLDLHEVGMRLCAEAMEETVTSEEAQDLFTAAEEKFQEMAAVALFNWGNVHMSRARKRVSSPEDSSQESMFTGVKSAFDWAEKEYIKAGEKYEEALRIKPNFYEAVLASAQQQFELAKLTWYYAIGTGVDLESWPSTNDVLILYNKAEENVEKGLHMWEDAEEQRVKELSQPNKIDSLLQKMKLDNLLNHISAAEAAEQSENIRSQIYILWGTMLYERSNMEVKLGLPVWQECLEVAIEKFELAGASATDVAVMIKNHCSNNAASEGLGFNIDEIVQAMNEMYEAKNLQKSMSSVRLEPLLRRRVSKLHYAFENA